MADNNPDNGPNASGSTAAHAEPQSEAQMQVPQMANTTSIEDHQNTHDNSSMPSEARPDLSIQAHHTADSNNLDPRLTTSSTPADDMLLSATYQVQDPVDNINSNKDQNSLGGLSTFSPPRTTSLPALNTSSNGHSSASTHPASHVLPRTDMASQSPYAAPPTGSYGAFPGSSLSSNGSFPWTGSSTYGAFPGAQASPPKSVPYAWPIPGSYGSFPGSSQQPSQSIASSRAAHHITDFSSFGGSGRIIPEDDDEEEEEEVEEPAHLAPQSPPRAMTEEDRLAHHFRTRNGDPDFLRAPDSVRRLGRAVEEGGDSLSHLAGIWYDDDVGGGRAQARNAWRAAMTYGGMYQYDAEAPEQARDPELQTLFEQADLPLFERKRGPSRKLTRGRGGWRRLLKGTEHENVGKAQKSESRRSRGGAPRGRRKKVIIEPGKPFRDLLQKANKSFVENDLTGAVEYARQAIQINPEVHQAYMLLSQILTSIGDYDAAVETMKMAAITSRTIQLWLVAADKIIEVAGENRTKAALKDAVECYTEALKCTAEIREKPLLELEIRSHKLNLHKEMQDQKGTRVECKHIVSKFPEKTAYCREYASYCAEWQDRSEMSKAEEAYDKAFEFYKDKAEFGDEEDPIDGFSHLNAYLELLDLLGSYQKGLDKGKQLARWFLGRKDETFWDRYTDDDREFDEENDRRNLVGEWQQGRASRDMSKYGQGLPIDIKVRFGLFRIKMGINFQRESVRHLKSLLQYADEIQEYYDLFRNVAIALRKYNFFHEAAEFFDHLLAMPNAEGEKIDVEVWMQFGTCYEALGRPEKAITCYEVVAGQHRGDSYVKACVRLSKMYEDMGETDRARYLANEVIKLNKRSMLYDAKVKEVPLIYGRPGPVSTPAPFEPYYAKAKSTPLQPLPPAKPLRQLAPAGQQWPPLPTEATFAASLAAKEHAQLEMQKTRMPRRETTGSIDSVPPSPSALSPAGSRPSTPNALQSDAAPLTKKRRRGRGKKPKTGLALLVGEVSDEDEEDDVEENTPKRVKRNYARRNAAMNKAAAEHAKRYQHIQDANAKARACLETCQHLGPVLEEGKDEAAVMGWVAAAKSMLDTFIGMKVFFPMRPKDDKTKGSDELDMNCRKLRAELHGPQEFLTISFSEWHQILVELTLYYASTGEQRKCYEMLQGVLFLATPFVTEHFEWVNNATAIYCGLAFNDSQYLIDIARKIASDADHRAPLTAHLFAALNRFPYGSNWFSAGPSQKWMLRLVKIFDYMAMTPEQRAQTDWSAQEPSLISRASKLESDANKTTEPDVQILMIYGHMVAQSNISHSALPYYYRALTLDPDNVTVNLSIATMWIQNSMKRQTENRQFGITQGLAFLYRYYDLRIATGRACHRQEAEYNVARMWHYLGLTHLALPAYEKALALSEQVQAERTEEDGPLHQDCEDFSKEAAYALQGIYSVVGNLEAARDITEKWLVL